MPLRTKMFLAIWFREDTRTKGAAKRKSREKQWQSTLLFWCREMSKNARECSRQYKFWRPSRSNAAVAPDEKTQGGETLEKTKNVANASAALDGEVKRLRFCYTEHEEVTYHPNQNHWIISYRPQKMNCRIGRYWTKTWYKYNNEKSMIHKEDESKAEATARAPQKMITEWWTVNFKLFLGRCV